MFSPGLSIPELCDCLEKATYDPRISGLFLNISPVAAGWSRLSELKRYLELFKRSGKATVAYMEIAGEKEYYIASMCDQIYLTPEG